MQIVRRASLAGALFLALAGGCAAPQLADREAAEYRRVDARLRAIDEYESFRQDCRRKGGVVYMNGSWGRLSRQPPDVTEMRCSMSVRNLGLRR